MKKIFTLIAALFVATVSFAETETELTFTEGHTLLLSTIEAEGGKDADLIRFYIINTSGESREGWGIGGFANSDNWSPIVEWTGKPGESWYYEYTVAAIKETAGTVPGQYHGLGVTVNIYNACKVEKVTLITAGNTITTTTAIWEGESNFGNWADGAGLLVPAEKFADAVAGDLIEFVYTTTENPEQNWYQFKTIFNGTENTLTSNAADLNEYGCATVSLGSKSYKFILNEDDLAQLKTTGLWVCGKDIICTQVNLIHKSEDTTGINAAQVEKAQSDAIYNLAGQKVNAQYKGVVIKNGKKVIQ
jgi:hypothetical protein